jgi:hypothetical protein
MIVALSLHVVALIKDLNGNHVIQKCLNKLPPEDNQVSHTVHWVYASAVLKFLCSVHLQFRRVQLRRGRDPPSWVLRAPTMH